MNKELIAKRYLESPDEFDSIPEEQIHLFRRLISRQFGEYAKNIYFDFVDTDPYTYSTVNDMRTDFQIERTIKINTSGNESNLWGKVYNLMFRGIHDLVHAAFDLDFNFEEERKAWRIQVRITKEDFENDVNLKGLDWDLFMRMLRSEIVYQAAQKEVSGDFHIQQKIILKDLTTL